MDEATMRRAIERKRDGEKLDASVWEAIVGAYMSGAIDDAQMAAFAMACVWRGLDADEAAALTRAMASSGEMLHFPSDPIVVDKHSSGGVSDVVSLIAVPLVAACGLRVAKLSGRALGHTGGTIDKLETIPGFNVALGLDDFVAQVEHIGCAIAAQTEAFVPADKRLYRLRDRTGTVPSVGLIAASIVSKKLAGGAHAFVFDVKCGNAAFMRTPQEAIALAEMLVGIARASGRTARALVTDMNEPLGRSIGTGIEVIEARDTLRGLHVDARLREGCVRIAGAMLDVADISDGEARIIDAFASGAAYEKFVAMVEAQGASRSALEAMERPKRVAVVAAERNGFVTAIDGVALGNAARDMSLHESTAGIRVAVRIGDRVAAGAPLLELFGNNDHHMSLRETIVISDAAPEKHPLVYAIR